MTVTADAGVGPSLGAVGVDGTVPGPELAAVLAGRDPGAVGDEELIDLMRGYRRLASWAQAAELATVRELARRRDAEGREVPRGRDGWVDGRAGPDDPAVDEVALALTLTVGSAYCWAELARDLTGRLSATHQALAEGRIDLAKTRVISGELDGLDDKLARWVEARVLPKAPSQTTGQLRARIRRLVRQANPGQADEQRREAEADRRVEMYDTATDTTNLLGLDLPQQEAQAAYRAVGEAAKALAATGDARSMDQLRADVFLDLLCGRPLPDGAQSPTPDPTPTPDPAPSSASPDRAEEASEAAVAKELSGAAARKVAEALAEAIADELTEVRALAGVAGLAADRRGGTALLIEAAVQRIAEAITEFKRRWCDAISGPADKSGRRRKGIHGHDGYRPPGWMQQLVQYRDGRCVFPICRRPAKQCDLDHSLAFDKGGTTCLCNLAPLCRRHHQLKQHPRWRLLQPWPGVVVWITPAGKWYISLADMNDHPDGPDPPE